MRWGKQDSFLGSLAWWLVTVTSSAQQAEAGSLYIPG